MHVDTCELVSPGEREVGELQQELAMAEKTGSIHRGQAVLNVNQEEESVLNFDALEGTLAHFRG